MVKKLRLGKTIMTQQLDFNIRIFVFLDECSSKLLFFAELLEYFCILQGKKELS